MLGVDNGEQLTEKYEIVEENLSNFTFLPGSVLFLRIFVEKKSDISK